MKTFRAPHEQISITRIRLLELKLLGFIGGFAVCSAPTWIALLWP